ncbi:hypothetical protein ACQ4PT_004884 [Festuca glaucescens]
MATRGGGRGGAENRGTGNRGRGNNGNANRGGYQGNGAPPNFTNFQVGGPSGTAGGQGMDQGQFMPGAGQHFNGFLGGGASQGGCAFHGGGGFPGGHGFQGGGYGGFQGNNGFMGNNGYQGNNGFLGNGFQGENYGFNAGTGFNDYSYRGGFRNRRGRGDGYRGRGRGWGRDTFGHGVVAAGDELSTDAEQFNLASAGTSGQGQSVSSGAGIQSTVQLAEKAQELAVTQAAIAAKVAGLADTLTKKGKKIDKLRCYRCKVHGHFIEDCPKPVCDICESIDHISDSCPMLTAPKPQILMYGLADEELVFFEMPLTGTFKPKSISSKLGMLSVSKGTLTIPQIVAQLKRLVPNENFQWDVKQAENNKYKVMFPSKTELERIKFFGTFKVPNSPCEMTLDSWDESIQPLYLLPEVWVQVSGLPDVAKDEFLALWFLGFLFGKTLRVDMPFMRQYGVLRILIGCMDYTRIPQGKHILVKDGFYDLSFEVEGPHQVIEDLVMAEAKHDGGNDHEHGPAGGRGDIEEPDNQDDDREGKRSKCDSSAEGAVVVTESSEPKYNKVTKKQMSAGVIFSPIVQRQFEEARAEIRALSAHIVTIEVKELKAVYDDSRASEVGQGHVAAEMSAVFHATAEKSASCDAATPSPAPTVVFPRKAVYVTVAGKDVVPDQEVCGPAFCSNGSRDEPNGGSHGIDERQVLQSINSATSPAKLGLGSAALHSYDALRASGEDVPHSSMPGCRLVGSGGRVSTPERK